MRIKYALMSLCVMFAMCALALCAGEKPNTSRPLVGAIRWDAWYGNLPASLHLPDPSLRPGYDVARGKLNPNPGKEAQLALSPDKWRYRWPFFTTLAPDGSAKEFNGNLPAVIEQEIEYAVHAGLDYWAFDAYPEDCPLSYSLKTFLTCKNRDKMKFCLFLVTRSAYGSFAEDEAFQAYVLRMLTQPNYLKVQGNRPVIYLGFLNDRLVEILLDGRWQGFCRELEKRGLGKPWLVICNSPPKSAKRYYDLLQGDALSQYNVSGGAKAGSFAELAARAEKFWEDCAATGAPVAPICVTGWDRRTRVMNPVSWERFHLQKDADSYYYKSGTPTEIAAHIGRGVSWFKKHPATNGSELVLIYAWNEIDEGGWLVPALPPPHGEGTARIDALRKVLAPPVPPIEKPGWKLTFHDEFDRPQLNDMYWFAAYRSGRKEYFQRIGKPSRWTDHNAYYVIENGILKLRIDEKLPFRPDKSTPCISCVQTSDHRFGATTNEYQILDKFAQKYGWFEVRCRCPRGEGLLSALWLHQHDPTKQEYTPEGGRKSIKDGVVEIDIIEQQGRCISDTNSTVDLNIHFTKEAHYRPKVDVDLSKDFHVWAMEWQEGQIDWHLDGKVVKTYKGPTPQEKMFVLMALFQYSGWIGKIDPNMTYPRDLEVDYVRVYARDKK